MCIKTYIFILLVVFFRNAYSNLNAMFSVWRAVVQGVFGRKTRFYQRKYVLGKTHITLTALGKTRLIGHFWEHFIWIELINMKTAENNSESITALSQTDSIFVIWQILFQQEKKKNWQRLHLYNYRHCAKLQIAWFSHVRSQIECIRTHKNAHVRTLKIL